MNTKDIQTVPCHFCANQGLKVNAVLLKGAEGRTKLPGYLKYGCENGHKFALPVPKVLIG